MSGLTSANVHQLLIVCAFVCVCVCVCGRGESKGSVCVCVCVCVWWDAAQGRFTCVETKKEQKKKSVQP